MTFYFMLKWVPKIVVDMGFTPSSAADVLVWANVGGATGGAVLGLLSLRFGLKPLTIFVFVMSTVMLAVFGRGQADLGAAIVDLRHRGLFHQRRNRRHVRHLRPSVPHSRARHRNGIRRRVRPLRRGARARHCRLFIPGGLRPRVRRHDHGGRLVAGCGYLVAAAIQGRGGTAARWYRPRVGEASLWHMLFGRLTF